MWHESSAVGWKPPEIDAESSPGIVYQRKDYVESTDDNGNTVWTFQERKLSHGEFIAEEAATWTTLALAYTEGVNEA